MSKSIKYYSSLDNKNIHKAPLFVRMARYQLNGQKNSNKYAEKKTDDKDR